MTGLLMGKSKISLVIVMLTTKDSSNFNRVNVNYEGILNEKKQDLKKKVNCEENLKTPHILTKETYIIRGFLMEKNKISLVILMLTIKDSSNFNNGNVHYERILTGKQQD